MKIVAQPDGVSSEQKETNPIIVPVVNVVELVIRLNCDPLKLASRTEQQPELSRLFNGEADRIERSVEQEEAGNV